MPIDFAFAANALRWEAEMQPGNEVLDVTIWNTLEHHILNVRFLVAAVCTVLDCLMFRADRVWFAVAHSYGGERYSKSGWFLVERSGEPGHHERGLHLWG